MKTFDIRIVIEHVGEGSSSIPAPRQPDFVALLEKHDPQPVAIDWADFRRSNQTVVAYRLPAADQFHALSTAREIFDRIFKPQLNEFQARLGALEADEAKFEVDG